MNFRKVVAVSISLLSLLLSGCSFGNATTSSHIPSSSKSSSVSTSSSVTTSFDIPSSSSIPVSSTSTSSSSQSSNSSSVSSSSSFSSIPSSSSSHTSTMPSSSSSSPSSSSSSSSSESSSSEHVHTFNDDHWLYDDTYHWHGATCEHTGLRKDEEVHSYNSTNNGEYITYTCKVCGYSFREQVTPPNPTYFTITWRNYDREVLEIDSVKKGETPVYHGDTPVRESNSDYDYVFSGWTPTIVPAQRNASYTAKYDAIKKNVINLAYEQIDDGYKLTITADKSAALTFNNTSNLQHADELSEIYVGKNIEVVDMFLIESTVLRKLTFSKDIKEIDWIKLSNDSLEGIFFEGNEPTIDTIVYNMTDGFSVELPYIFYDPNTEGWEGFSRAGCMLRPINGWNPEVPEMTLNEWADTMVEVSNERVTKNYTEMVANGEEELFMVPPDNDIEGNQVIKEFAIQLVEGKTTNMEKINAIFSWVSENITYDDNYMRATMYEAFVDKRGVCAHYTSIMRHMLASVGIVSFAIQCIGRFNSGISSINQMLIDPHKAKWGSHILLAIYEDNQVMYYDPTWHEAYGTNYVRVAQAYYIYAVNYVTIISNVVDPSLLDYGYEPYVAWVGDRLFGFINGHILYPMSLSFGTNSGTQTFLGCSYRDGNNFEYGEIYRSVLHEGGGLFEYTFSRCDGLNFNFMTLYQYFLDTDPTYMERLLVRHNSKTIHIFDDFIISTMYDEPMVAMYNGKEKNLVVPAKFGDDIEILGVSEYAFSDNPYIETVTFSDGITEISQSAFYNCQNLKTVSLPNTMRHHNYLEGLINSIGVPANPIKHCLKFEQFIVGEGNPYFKTVDGNLYSKDGECLYSAAPMSNNLSLAGVKYILQESCEHASIDTLIIPSSMEKIRGHAFAYCQNLRTVIYEGNDIEEDGYTFYACPSLSKVTLPRELKKVSSGKFNGCVSLAEIQLPETVETIGNWSFISSGLVHINLPASLTSIGESAFSGCEKLYDIDNYSSLELTIGLDDYSDVARYAKDISTTSYTHSVNDFVFYHNGEDHILVSYTGTITGDSLTLPTDIYGYSYSVDQYFFLEGSMYFSYSSAGTSSIVEFPVYNSLHNVKTIYIPSGIDYGNMLKPTGVAVQVI